MRYLSVCSGIEAATVAWHQLGWEAAAFSEIEAFPRAVLKHHYPDTPLHGDFTTIGADDYGTVDLLVGGTPCQSFSVAGLRGGLGDDRGNLALEYLRLADRKRPRWLVWENVPGVLSSDGGRDFGSILGGMVELGYHGSYRVLDAQHFGVPQRRRRVFVVGHLGDWRRAAAVLFERHSLSGHPAPRRQAGKDVARSIRAQSQSSHREDSDNFIPCIAGTLKSCGGKSGSSPNGAELADQLIAHSLRGEGFDASEDGTGRGTPLVPVAFGGQMSTPMWDVDLSQTLQAKNPQAVAFTVSGPSGGFAWEKPYASAVMATPPSDTANTQTGIRIGSAVRRLTPRECERLQGFPDDYTLVPYRGKLAADGPRYKALGNSMAVPVMRWIGERITAVEALQSQAEAA